jgi:hypothetical protein
LKFLGSLRSFLFSNTLNYDNIKEYVYPSDPDITKNSVKGIYLGNYNRWNLKVQQELMVDVHGYK